MANVILYCGYTDKALAWNDLGFTTVLQKCGADNRYESGLRKIWNCGADIIIVEHDMNVTDSHIEELADCPSILCAFAYKVYPVTTGEHEPRLAQANRIPYTPAEGFYRYIKEGDTWADHAGFGFIKLGALARATVTHWEEGEWNNLDTRVSQALNDEGLKFHIHWPEVEHLHK